MASNNIPLLLSEKIGEKLGGNRENKGKIMKIRVKLEGKIRRKKKKIREKKKRLKNWVIIRPATYIF